MTIHPGSRVGPYEILSRIGAGGMGEVFRARDTRLGRTVAVKALPAQFAQSAQLRLRLQREARAISSLTHPHICALYDVGEENGVDYLVMEYLEGETLADRLSKGALPLDEALRYAIEIGEALEVAHREGIVHRDLKPGNIILTKSGAKLLDFGLARTAADAAPITADAPTVQAPQNQPLTAEGTIVGTFQYMAPEQLEGLPADARTDIFAYGAVMYEMITGKRAFDGKTKTSLIAAIVAGTPAPIASIRPIAPSALEHVVQRCLDKDPDARWQSAHDVRLELEWIARSHASPEAVKARSTSKLPWLVAAIVLLLAIAAGVLGLRTKPRVETPLHTHLLAPRGKDFSFLLSRLTISPDGRYVTFGVLGDPRLWLRAVDSLEAKPIEGTERAEFPFWSPDSRWIVFSDTKKLKKVGLTGAPPVTLADAGLLRGGAFLEDGSVLFAPNPVTPIKRLAPNGTVTDITKLDTEKRETTHRWPVVLPDGKHFFYLAGAHTEVAGSDLNAVWIAPLDAPHDRKLLLRARSNVAYANGHLLYVKDNVLVAHPFDEKKLEVRGEPFRLADRVAYHSGYFASPFSAAGDGTIVYQSEANPESRLAWFIDSRLGEPFGVPMPFISLTVSPDGRRAVAEVAATRETDLADLWLIELAEDRRTRLTSTNNMAEWLPIWAPDNRRFAFARGLGYGNGGDLVIYDTVSGAETKIFSGGEHTPRLHDWSADGRWISFGLATPNPGRDTSLYVLDTLTGKHRPFIATEADEDRGMFSPDGKWIAYVSNDSGKPQAYATTFPNPSPRIEIASLPAGGLDWTPEGIFIVSEWKLYLVPVEFNGDRISFGAPRNLGNVPKEATSGWVVDSKRQLLSVAAEDDYADTVTLLRGWSAPKQ
jgi:eukaryotic-like serine/threonine-protein kinase